MFESETKTLHNMNRMLKSKTDMFLDDGTTTTGKLLIKYNGMHVIIPLDMPEVNITVQQLFSDIVDALELYQ